MDTRNTLGSAQRWQREPLAGNARDAQAKDGRGRCACKQDGPDDLGTDNKGAGLQNGVTQAREGSGTAWPQGRGERSTRSRRHGLRRSRREIQTRRSSACSSLNRCEPSLPNSIPARGVMNATLRGLTHVRSKTPPTNQRFCLPNRGHPHTPPNPIAQTWKPPFAKSIASMLIGVVIDVPSLRFR